MWKEGRLVETVDVYNVYTKCPKCGHEESPVYMHLHVCDPECVCGMLESAHGPAERVGAIFMHNFTLKNTVA